MGKDSSAFREGLPNIVEHTKTNYIFKWLIYGSVMSIGIDFEHLTRGWLIFCTQVKIFRRIIKKRKMADF